MPDPLVITVVLNNNRKADTLEALQSLDRSTYANHRVIVLDNASSDGSVEAIAAAFPAVRIIQLSENLGYAGNNNTGICAAIQQGAEWVFTLNEDTVVAPDCLERLVQVGSADAGVGILGPLVYHHDEPDVIQSAGGMLGPSWQSQHLAQNQRDQGQLDVPRDVDWITGCAILVRRQVIEQVGMLDPRFFSYWEETDWCLRARKAGWRVVNVPQAHLWHKGVQRNYQPSSSVTYYFTRNHFLLLKKHHAPLTVWVHVWWQALRTLLSWSLRPKWRSKSDHRDALWQGMIDFLRHRWGIRAAGAGGETENTPTPRRTDATA